MTASEEKNFLGAAAFDPQRAIDELSAATPDARERKLTFRDQCGLFAALYFSRRTMKRSTICEAFGVNISTVARMAGCLEHDPQPFHRELALEEGAPPVGMTPDEIAEARHRGTMGGKIVENTIPHDFNKNRHPERQRHYPRVAAEFRALGPEEFRRRYYTEEIHLRLMAVKYRRDNEAALVARSRMIDEHANDAAGLYKYSNDPDQPKLTFAVHWIEGGGWTVGSPDRPKPNLNRYRTSEMARTAFMKEALLTLRDIEGPSPIPDDYKFFTPPPPDYDWPSFKKPQDAIQWEAANPQWKEGIWDGIQHDPI
jgi:hypothetical protein